jgi:hypothetical protein
MRSAERCLSPGANNCVSLRVSDAQLVIAKTHSTVARGYRSPDRSFIDWVGKKANGFNSVDRTPFPPAMRFRTACGTYEFRIRPPSSMPQSGGNPLGSSNSWKVMTTGSWQASHCKKPASVWTLARATLQESQSLWRVSMRRADHGPGVL